MSKTEFFRYMTSIPDKNSREYEAFFQEEQRKIEYGLTVDGVFIPGWLYWHTNHWKIYQDIEDHINHTIKRVFETPIFRDNEWIISESREKAIAERKGLVIIGSRRLGKSEVTSSIIGRGATIYQGSENVLSAGNDKDLKLTWDKTDKGLNTVHPYFRWARIENDPKRQITLGLKDKEGNKIPWSTILPRNYSDGNNTEAAAGITAKEFIIEEIGKFPFLRCLEAAIPAFTSPYGWRCSPLLIGTGGSFDKGHDAESLFNNPEAYNFLSIEVKDEPKKYGLFIPGTYRMEAKRETTLGDYINTLGISLNEKSELYNIRFQESDKEKAEKEIKISREQAKQANDQEAYLKAIMYYPLTPEECFLTASQNIFNSQLATAQRNRVLNEGITGSYIELFHDGHKIQHKFIDSKPLSKYPHSNSDNLDTPIVMWEPPIPNAPWSLYVAGVDSYRDATAKYSQSLGAVYIFKRIHDIQSEKFQDMLVACYVGRPKDKEKWNEQARLLIKYYNAAALIENDEISFIEYMKAKGDQQYMVKTASLAWVKEIVPNTSSSREYGISRATARIGEYLHNCLKRYMSEVIDRQVDEEGSVTKEVLGVNRILDPVLLEEIVKFNEDTNVDRIIAVELALAMAYHLDPLVGRIGNNAEDERIKAVYSQKNNHIFNSSGNLFKRKGKNKLFR